MSRWRGKASCRKTRSVTVSGCSLFLVAVTTWPATERIRIHHQQSVHVLFPQCLLQMQHTLTHHASFRCNIPSHIMYVDHHRVLTSLATVLYTILVTLYAARTLSLNYDTKTSQCYIIHSKTCQQRGNNRHHQYVTCEDL